MSDSLNHNSWFPALFFISLWPSINYIYIVRIPWNSSQSHSLASELGTMNFFSTINPRVTFVQSIGLSNGTETVSKNPFNEAYSLLVSATSSYSALLPSMQNERPFRSCNLFVCLSWYDWCGQTFNISMRACTRASVVGRFHSLWRVLSGEVWSWSAVSSSWSHHFTEASWSEVNISGWYAGVISIKVRELKMDFILLRTREADQEGRDASLLSWNQKSLIHDSLGDGLSQTLGFPFWYLTDPWPFHSSNWSVMQCISLQHVWTTWWASDKRCRKWRPNAYDHCIPQSSKLCWTHSQLQHMLRFFIIWTLNQTKRKIKTKISITSIQNLSTELIWAYGQCLPFTSISWGICACERI